MNLSNISKENPLSALEHSITEVTNFQDVQQFVHLSAK